MRSLFSGQQQLPDASSGGAKAGAAQSVGAQQHVLFPVGEEREREKAREGAHIDNRYCSKLSSLIVRPQVAFCLASVASCLKKHALPTLI
jgi:hypothetical protein